MALTVDNVLDRASATLLDVLKVRYPAADLVRFLSDAQRAVCRLKPAAYSTTITITLVAGTLQSVPVSANRLLDVVCNTNVSGSIGGRSIRPIARAMLDSENINWQFKPLSKTVERYVYEPDHDSAVFYVYPAPASPGAQYVRCIFGLHPPECTVGGALTIDQIYHDLLMFYVVAVTIARDGEHADQLQRGELFMRNFYNGLGVQPPNATQ